MEIVYVGYTLSDLGLDSELGLEDEASQIRLVHGNVPTSTCEVIGVPSLMSRMMEAEQPLDFGFGQTDSLTLRLHALIDDYADGLAVPKELIQNADDAGATEVSQNTLLNTLYGTVVIDGKLY